MKIFLTITLCCASLAAQPSNHHLATDTEVGSDGSVTQYLLYEYNRPDKVVGVSGVALYIRGGDGSELIETGAGLNFQCRQKDPPNKKPQRFLDTYFGRTKDGRMIAAVIGGVNLPGNLYFMVASDPKFSVGHSSTQPNAWFRRAWLGREHFFVRWEDLPVAGLGIVTGKIGVEARWEITNRAELYSYPHYDYQQAKWGATIGIRIKFQ